MCIKTGRRSRLRDLEEMPNGERALAQNRSEGGRHESMALWGGCGGIASTMDEDMFTLVVVKWQRFAESAKETSDWFPSTTSGFLLKEMIHMLDYILKAADRSTSEGEREVRVARILLYKVFYDHTENGILPFLLCLIKAFDMHKQPRSQLADLVETAHIVLRLLDSITAENGTLRVLKKARNGKRKDKKDMLNDTSVSCTPSIHTEAQTDHEVAHPQENNQENLHTSELNSNICGTTATNVENYQEGTGACPGERGPESDEEIQIERVTTAGLMQEMEVDNEIGEEFDKDSNREGEEEIETGVEEDHDGESDDETEPNTKEQSLNVYKCVKMFANNTVLNNYCWLLKNYTYNTAATNYYIVRMLQRICEDCLLEPMLYQISILQMCYEILSNRAVQVSEQHQFVVAFLTRLVRHLFQKLKRSPLLFVDLLFWKTKEDCHCITADYIIHQLGGDAGGKGRALSKQKIAPNMLDRRALLSESLGDDEDTTVPTVSTLFRTQNSEVGGDQNQRGKVKRQRAIRKRGPFSDEQEEQIKELFEQYKDKRNCSQLIAQELSGSGPVGDSNDAFSAAQVGRALKRFGLKRVVKGVRGSNLLQNLNSLEDSEDNDDGDKEDCEDLSAGGNGTLQSPEDVMQDYSGQEDEEESAPVNKKQELKSKHIRGQGRHNGGELLGFASAKSTKNTSVLSDLLSDEEEGMHSDGENHEHEIASKYRHGHTDGSTQDGDPARASDHGSEDVDELPTELHRSEPREEELPTSEGQGSGMTVPGYTSRALRASWGSLARKKTHKEGKGNKCTSEGNRNNADEAGQMNGNRIGGDDSSGNEHPVGGQVALKKTYQRRKRSLASRGLALVDSQPEDSDEDMCLADFARRGKPVQALPPMQVSTYSGERKDLKPKRRRLEKKLVTQGLQIDGTDEKNVASNCEGVEGESGIEGIGSRAARQARVVAMDSDE